MTRLRMELRWFYQRQRVKILFSLGCLVCVILLYTVHNRLLYFENNLPFVAKTINVPYDAQLHPDNIRIPKIIHQTWKTKSVPKHLAEWMRSWQEKHPEFEYWFWTDEDSRRLIARKYPDFLPLFDSYAFNIQRADVIRYFILYEYGGFYADLDVEVMKPIDGLLQESCYLSQEPLEHTFFYWGMSRLACNAIMACRPRHPYFKHVLENLKFYQGQSIGPFVKVAMPVMQSSGPIMVTFAMETYERIKSVENVNRVHLWPPEYFYPDADKTSLPYVKSKCEDRALRETFSQEQEKVCAYHEKTEYTNTPHENSYAYHHWVHTYFGLKSSEVVPIKTVNKKVKLASEILDS